MVEPSPVAVLVFVVNCVTPIVLLVSVCEPVNVATSLLIDMSILLLVIAVVIPLVPTISRVPPNASISLVLEDSSPIVIVEFAKLAFDILAEPDKFEFVNPVIVLLL